jgi:hypothetical protein
MVAHGFVERAADNTINWAEGMAPSAVNDSARAMMARLAESGPSAFVLPFGQAISRTAYATLFSLVGTIYGSGDGSTIFNIPDLRGRASLASTTWEGLQLRGSAAIGMEGFLAILAVLRIGH